MKRWIAAAMALFATATAARDGFDPKEQYLALRATMVMEEDAVEDELWEQPWSSLRAALVRADSASSYDQAAVRLA